MLIAAFVFLFVMALSPRVPERCLRGLLLWPPVLFCAVAAMHWTAALHLPDPLASLYAFLTVAFIGRVVLELVLLAALSKADRVRG